jgi:hypothetical protein
VSHSIAFEDLLLFAWFRTTYRLIKGLAHWPRRASNKLPSFSDHPSLHSKSLSRPSRFSSSSRLVSLPAPLARPSSLVTAVLRVRRVNASKSRSFPDPNRAASRPRRSCALPLFVLPGSHPASLGLARVLRSTFSAFTLSRFCPGKSVGVQNGSTDTLT